MKIIEDLRLIENSIQFSLENNIFEIGFGERNRLNGKTENSRTLQMHWFGADTGRFGNTGTKNTNQHKGYTQHA